MSYQLLTLRKAANLTQADVAKAVGVSRSLVDMWERGARDIRVKHLVKLADFFGVSTDFLLGRNYDGAVDSHIARDVMVEALKNINAHAGAILKNIRDIAEVMIADG